MVVYSRRLRTTIMRVTLLAFALVALATALSARAATTIYRVVQADGTIVYTTERLPGAKPVSPDDVPPPPSTTLPPPGPADVPRDTAPQTGAVPKSDRTPVAPKPAGR
jgi:hypothetical protein